MIAIPNMGRPQNCAECPLSAVSEFSGIVCKLNRNNNKNNCPLIDIVQCNDCKYGHKHILKDTYDCDKSDITVFHEADFFCKASERRER